jgi:mannitol/fructose-specific phosphotransferase system IIA component (Ntr-type)
MNDSTSPLEFPSDAKGERHMALTDVFSSDCVVSIPSSTDKTGVIRRLVYLLVNNHRLEASRAEAITQDLIQRESYGSSALGKGFAFPHLRISEFKCIAGVIGVASQGLDFESLDYEPTKLVFLTLSPIDRREQHMNLLYRLVSLMRDKVLSMQLHHFIQPHEVYRYLQDLDDHFEASVEYLAAVPGYETDD